MADDSEPPSGPESCHGAVQQRPGYGWRPSLLYSQHFGLPPVLDSRDLLWLESVVRKLGDSSWPGYARASALAPPADQPGSKVHREMGGGLSEVYEQHGKWKVSLDVNHFAPSEIAVKMEGGFLEITGKHDERQDAHGYISRCFIRKYKLPVGVDAETIQSFSRLEMEFSVKTEAPVPQGEPQDDLAGEGCALGQGLPAGGKEAAREKPGGESASGQSEADDEVHRAVDLPAVAPDQSSTEAGEAPALGLAEGPQEGDGEQRGAKQVEAGVEGKQEGAEEGLENAEAADMGAVEGLKEPDAPPTLEKTGTPLTSEQSEALQTPEQPEASPIPEETGAPQTPEQPEASPNPEETGAPQTPEQTEGPSTPDTITFDQEEHAELEQVRELQEPAEEREMQHVEEEHEHLTTQEVMEEVPPLVDVQEELLAKKLETTK
ncbi:hypothetical protein P4O66_012083 [Electrophorus voltai]|uniref:SHSP domain-containing protein n=1 Tax=Electrophorus voltai TaxID=2609070 RepID=A0AAD8Z4R6_9TELE|nr:hypothetical protein P4O66_012083 [Electrophorus voltai]